jgi:hypothetical protein
VYYRLSKQRYKEIKDELKRNAVALGLDFFTKARQAEKTNDPITALGFYYQGFRAVEKYLAEPLRITLEGNDILLTNEIISSMQLLLDKMHLAVSPTQIMLNRIVAQSGQVVTATATAVLTSFSIPGIPGGSIIAMVPVLASVGLPAEGIGVLLGVDTIPDAFRTTANVTGQMAAAVIAEHRHA